MDALDSVRLTLVRWLTTHNHQLSIVDYISTCTFDANIVLISGIVLNEHSTSGVTPGGSNHRKLFIESGVSKWDACFDRIQYVYVSEVNLRSSEKTQLPK